MPTYAARRTLPAPREDVWRYLSEPEHLARWWPGIAGVRAGRGGLAPGARWELAGPARGSYLRRPDGGGKLLVLEVVPPSRIAFQLTGDRIDAELDLRGAGEVTEAELSVSGPWLIGLSRRFPQRALQQLAARISQVPAV